MKDELKYRRSAIVSAKGLGDALLTMTLAYNLHKKGHEVHFYSDVLSLMADYFPFVAVHPFASYTLDAKEILQRYDFCVFADGLLAIEDDSTAASRLFVLNRDQQNRSIHYIHSFCQQMQDHGGLDVAIETMDNGLTLPAKYSFRKYAKRIILHPTSSRLSKNWPMPKFIKLAQLLRASGYQPVFILTDSEKDYQQMLEPHAIEFVSLALNELVPYLYESGAIVANDSGPGHLAAFTGIPTLSIFPKKSRSSMWRPVGDNVSLIWPRFRLPGSRGSRYWQRFLSVRQVHRALMARLRDQ
ncbi:glycosyltransferase family 9 protein [Coraliomargarita sp. SDUM461004]|uniref:Glycosyltransferase family 9 protein n=1 Tax=Thalassobacterium sedimentorum TaxID=3041258 RepID=A0ABU1AK06_9BACT|nr:glycosyltransferase family 9 protein [Coraliomargarita sp. SDUM461004]MDQ8195150.1 glycosyltransferase family 9 protein [Coraliomargarita sp. SDUM461004]